MDVERLGKRELRGSPLDIFSLAIQRLPHSVDNVRHYDADVKMGHPRCGKSTSFSCHRGIRMEEFPRRRGYGELSSVFN